MDRDLTTVPLDFHHRPFHSTTHYSDNKKRYWFEKSEYCIFVHTNGLKGYSIGQPTDLMSPLPPHHHGFNPLKEEANSYFEHVIEIDR